eukprot:Gb_18916 [translate_table: standard]
MGYNDLLPQIDLPPGFRFYPTDEELVVHYLCKRAASQPFAVPIIAEIDLYKFDPWDLPEKALFGEKEWYFFSPRDRKYPNGSRPNRAAGSGYWKATGTDKPITSAGSKKVGVKKALVFYKGKAPKGMKTNWIMHEYRLADSASRAAKRKGSLRLDDWVLCRIYKKNFGGSQKALAKERNESSCVEDDILASLPDIDDSKILFNLPRINSLNRINALKVHTEEKPNGMQIDHTADNISISGAQIINDSMWRNSASGMMNYNQKQQFSNGATDADTAAMTEVASSRCCYPMEYQNVQLVHNLPSSLHMCSPVGRPWTVPTMNNNNSNGHKEEEVESSFRVHQNNGVYQPSSSPQLENFSFDQMKMQTTNPFPHLETMTSLGNTAFYGSLVQEFLQRL